MGYKKIKTILVYGKKKCIYMKQKGTREYVKSKGEYVLLPVYVKRVAKIAAKKIVKIKNGKKKLRGGGSQLSLKVQVTHCGNMHVADSSHVLDLCTIRKLDTELVLLSEENMQKRRSPGGKIVTMVKINDKDKSYYRTTDQVLINVRSSNNNENISSNSQNFLIKEGPSNGTAYYKRYQTGKIEKIYSTKIDYIREYEKGGISEKIYYHIFELGEGEQIYSEKDRCKLQLNLSEGDFNNLKFNINDVKKILFDYKPPFEKLYIYDSDGYKELCIPDNLNKENTRELAKYNKSSQYPVTHTRMVFKTPDSSRLNDKVTADIIGDEKYRSIFSKIVGSVKKTTQTVPKEVNVNDPLNDHYSINAAFKNSRKNTISSKVGNVLSRLTGKSTTKGPSILERSGGSIKSLSLKK
jgi:hypothetical protein